MAEATTHIADGYVSGTTTQTIDFGTIPGTYDDLLIMGSGHNNSTAGKVLYMDLYFNGVTSNFYTAYNSYTNTSGYGMQSDTTSAGVIRMSNICGDQNSDLSWSGFWLYMPGYANTSYKKTGWCYHAALSNSANWTGGPQFGYSGAFHFGTSAAITQIELKTLFGYFNQYSNYDLYGIKNS